MRRAYKTDAADGEWSIRSPLLDRKGSRGPRAWGDLREVWNGAMRLPGASRRWRSLPHESPHHGTVCHSFHRWRREGVLEAANDGL